MKKPAVGGGEDRGLTDMAPVWGDGWDGATLGYGTPFPQIPQDGVEHFFRFVKIW